MRLRSTFSDKNKRKCLPSSIFKSKVLNINVYILRCNHGKNKRVLTKINIFSKNVILSYLVMLFQLPCDVNFLDIKTTKNLGMSCKNKKLSKVCYFYTNVQITFFQIFTLVSFVSVMIILTFTDIFMLGNRSFQSIKNENLLRKFKMVKIDSKHANIETVNFLPISNVNCLIWS